MTDKLAEICAIKREEVAIRKPRGLSHLPSSTAPRGFRAAIETKAASGFALIAEIKKASPSKGLIRNDFHPAAHARAYAEAGAACLSVLTDKPYFQGDDAYLAEARDACALPALRKDFMVDPWQVLEARALGADAILIIMAALDDSLAAEIEAAAMEHGMDALIEVHDEAELGRALRLKSRLIGVNNRDLRTFKTDIMTSRHLAALAPPDILLVSESGINRHDDLMALSQYGIRAFLVGEALMRQDDVAAATRTLLVGA